jgi:uncharacterized protein YjbJ (UPF0337 family)
MSSRLSATVRKIPIKPRRKEARLVTAAVQIPASVGERMICLPEEANDTRHLRPPMRSPAGLPGLLANLNRASNQIVAGLFNDRVNAQGAEAMSMNEDRFAGTGKNPGGHVEQGFGRATDDVKTEVEGKIKQATGAAQDVYGQAKDAAGEAYGQAKDAVGDAARSMQEQAAPLEEFLRNAIESRPYTSVAVALGIGWFIGRMGGHSDY